MSSLSQQLKERIINLYKDPKQGLSNIKDLYKKINKDQKLTTYKQIKDIISNIDVVQQFAKVDKKQLDYIPIASHSNSYQMDLMFIDKIQGFNDRIIGLLNIINMNTRKCYSYPIKNKSAEHVFEQFKLFLDQVGQIFSISNDKGKEFNNKYFKEYLEKNDIKFIIFDKELSPNGNMLIERFNKTIRGRIDKYLKLNKTKRYIDILQDLVDNYNNSIHESTNEIPNELDQQKYLDLNAHINKANKLNEIHDKINISDDVRLLKQKKGERMFQKGQKNYSKNVYNIKEHDDLGFIVENEKGDEQRVMPFMLKQVNKQDLIVQNDKQKGLKKQLQKQQKVKRNLIKEGYDSKKINQNLFNFD